MASAVALPQPQAPAAAWPSAAAAMLQGISAITPQAASGNTGSVASPRHCAGTAPIHWRAPAAQAAASGPNVRASVDGVSPSVISRAYSAPRPSGWRATR